MILQIDLEVIEPIAVIFILMMLMVIMILLYLKLRVFLIILVLFLFSLILGFASFGIADLPFSPYLQIFFILFQSIIFLMFSLEVWKKK